MAVSSYIISELFPNKLSMKLQSAKSRFPVVYATIFNPLITIKENAVYIVIDPKDFPQEGQPSTFIVIGELDENTMSETPHDVICLPRDSEIGKIYELVVELLERYARWHSEMNEVLMKDGTFEELCAVCRPIINKPFLIASSDYRVLAVSDDGGRFQDSSVSEKGFLKEESVVEIVGAVETDNSDNSLHFGIVNRKLVVTMEREQQVIWQIIADNSDKEFSDGDITRFAVFGQYLSRYLEYSPNGGIALNELKNSLYGYLFSKKTRLAELISSLSAYGWGIDDEYLCCVIKLRFGQNERNILNYLCGYIGHHLSGALAVRENKAIYLLCNLTRSNSEKNERIAEIVRISKDFGMSVGISSEFSDISLVRDYFNQSRAVLSFCENKQSEKGVYCFDDCRLEYLLKKGYSSLPINALLTPKLFEFLQNDSTLGFENYKILRAFIRANLNVSEAAAKLYLHRSSFIYRLDKIKKMLDTEFTGEDEVLYLGIIFRAVDEQFGIGEEFCENENTDFVKIDEINRTFHHKCGKQLKSIETDKAV